jgi:hypothetical protein
MTSEPSGVKSCGEYRPSLWRRVVVYGLLLVTVLLSICVGYGLSTLPSSGWVVLAFTIAVIIGIQMSYLIGVALLSKY